MGFFKTDDVLYMGVRSNVWCSFTRTLPPLKSRTSDTKNHNNLSLLLSVVTARLDWYGRSLQLGYNALRHNDSPAFVCNSGNVISGMKLRNNFAWAFRSRAKSSSRNSNPRNYTPTMWIFSTIRGGHRVSEIKPSP